MAKLPLFIKFDFRHYIPTQDLSANILYLDESICGADSFVASIKADNLIPGHLYRTTYSLISPTTTESVFNPSISTLFASNTSQNFVTSVSLPKITEPKSNSYILQATVKDTTEGFSEESTTQINLICGIQRQAFNLQILDTDLEPASQDNIIHIGDCSQPFPLVCMINDAVIGEEYSYSFIDNPNGSIMFENRDGSIVAGNTDQNFNTKIAMTGYPYSFIHAKAIEKNSGITKLSQPVLLQCFQTDPCDVVLPTGIDCAIGVPTIKKCSNRGLGLTTASISRIYGGSGFSVGDKLTTVGGGGYGAEIELLFGGITTDTFSSFYGGTGFDIGDLIEVTGGGGSGGLIQIVSGGLTDNSINSLSGCSNFNIGDLLTTVGGGGKDALISVTATGLNGSISSYEVISPGYGYTNSPSGVINITGKGTCAAASFNNHNFTIPCAGGVTTSSISLQGGTGYNIGELLDVIGGGGNGAHVKVVTGSLSEQSIAISGGLGYAVGDYLSTEGGEGEDVVIRVSSVDNTGAISAWTLLNPGHGFLSAPTSLITLTGSGSSASLVANAENFAITPEGAITKSSISNFINTGLGYSIGDQLLIVEGNGYAGLIEIIAVSNTGAIVDFIIKNPGYKYSAVPQVVSLDQFAIDNQPIWNINKYTKYSYVVVSSGCDYRDSPTDIRSVEGDGNGVSFSVDISKFTPSAFIVVNTGSGYTSAPTGIIVRSGDGIGVTAIFNDSNFTIPCANGITYSSIDGLLGKSVFILGEELIVSGGSGVGGRIKITSVNSEGGVEAFVVLNAGCDYTSEPLLKRLNGTVVNGISFDTEEFTKLAISVINPGSGFVDIPTGVAVLTGNGSVESVLVVYNENNFEQLIDFEITRSPTPTPTITPSQSPPVRCNDLQSAGGQNINTTITIAVNASIGQNYLIIADVEGLQKYSILTAEGIPSGAYITQIDNFFANFDNRTIYKKIALSSSLTADISKGSVVSLYTTDNRLIKVPYWPGNMRFDYDAYSVPDRFIVFAVPLDNRLSETVLFDSGYRGDVLCGHAQILNGLGRGSVDIHKPDGCIFIRVVVDAPCPGTAWEYSLACPQRSFTTVTSTPTPTPTVTPSRSSV